VSNAPVITPGLFVSSETFRPDKHVLCRQDERKYMTYALASWKVSWTSQRGPLSRRRVSLTGSLSGCYKIVFCEAAQSPPYAPTGSGSRSGCLPEIIGETISCLIWFTN
jgi:hypothetical protein